MKFLIIIYFFIATASADTINLGVINSSSHLLDARFVKEPDINDQIMSLENFSIEKDFELSAILISFKPNVSNLSVQDVEDEWSDLLGVEHD